MSKPKLKPEWTARPPWRLTIQRLNHPLACLYSTSMPPNQPLRHSNILTYLPKLKPRWTAGLPRRVVRLSTQRLNYPRAYPYLKHLTTHPSRNSANNPLIYFQRHFKHPTTESFHAMTIKCYSLAHLRRNARSGGKTVSACIRTN